LIEAAQNDEKKHLQAAGDIRINTVFQFFRYDLDCLPYMGIGFLVRSRCFFHMYRRWLKFQDTAELSGSAGHKISRKN